MNPKKPHSERLLTAALLAAVVFALLVVTAPDIGLTWDEPAYIAAARSYTRWFGWLTQVPDKALREEVITRAWEVNHEHPALDKIWNGAFWALTKGMTDDLTAHRMGNMLLASALTGLVYAWAAEAGGRAAGFAAAGALMSMPRFFFHAHLAALDVPAAFSIFVVSYAFWKTRARKGWAWGLVLGLLWGLALATKINAIFIPFTLGLWWLIFSRRGYLALRLVIMGVSALPVFFLTWPWLWANTGERLVEYLLFVTVNHWEIGQYYLGQFFMPPPWHFGLVMLWAVLPLALSVLALVGAIARWRGRDEGMGWLLVFSALAPVLAIAVSRSLVYDNERMYMAAFPFLASLAGLGFGALLAKWKHICARGSARLPYLAGALALALVAFLPQSIRMAQLYPNLLAYYGEGVGGAAGARSLGLETTYWCETYALALPTLNEQAQPGDTLWADPWSHDVLIYYQTQGRLRKDLVILSPSPATSILGDGARNPVALPMIQADWYLAQSRQSTLGYEQERSEIARVLARQELVEQTSFQGVVLFSLYRGR